jgi:anti-sigma regulatory factor (Ser/Thr protein kinase)
MTLILHASSEEVMRGVEVLQEFASAHGVPEKAVFSLSLALEECGSNIVNHGLQRNAVRTFQVVFERAADAFLIELHDDGPAFDPTSTPARTAPVGDDDLPGGWGIPIVRRQMDEIRYRREGRTNVLRLIKRLVSGTGTANL